MKQHRTLVIAVFVLFSIGWLLPQNVATAKGPFAKVMISGCYLPPALEVTDPALLEFFSFSVFYKARIEIPSSLGEGYTVTRYIPQDDATLVAWDRLHYYPGNATSGGVVYYDGLIGGGSEYDGYWYRASPEGDALMHKLFAAQGVEAAKAVTNCLTF